VGSFVDGAPLKIKEGERTFFRDLARIERFVEHVLQENSPAFEQSEVVASVHYLNLPLAEYIRDIARFNERYLLLLDAYWKNYQFSPNVELFVNCWQTSTLEDGLFTVPKAQLSREGKSRESLFNGLVDAIRRGARDLHFHKNGQERKNNARRNFRNAAKYIENLFLTHSNLWWIRAELFYSSEYEPKIDLRQAKSDLARLLNNRRNKPSLFANSVGLLWTLHCAPEKGLFFHVIFFYAGEKPTSESALSSQIGQYWQNAITRGRGALCPYGASWDDPDRVQYEGEDRKQHLLKEVFYLTHYECYLRAVILADQKCFGHGEQKRLKLATV